MMFQLAIDQYEKKHGVVIPRGEFPSGRISSIKFTL